MEQQPTRFIALTYQLYSVSDGERHLEEQTSDEHPFRFLTGFGISLDALEQHVTTIEKGQTFLLTLQPEQAFGPYHPEGAHKLSKEMFVVNGRFDNQNVYPGAVITLSDQEDNQFMARVTAIDETDVSVDTNHPLAGKVLEFEGTVVENRLATADEINFMIKQLTGDRHCGGCGGCEGGCEGGCCSE